MKTTASLKDLLLISTLAALTSCASVPMAPPEQDAASKTFAAPPADKAGLYVYRNCFVGQALTKTVFLDGVSIGDTASDVYLHREISPGEHTLATESEFSENALEFTAASGKNYFFEQYLKLGVFVGGANLQAVSEEVGKKGVLSCNEAIGVTTVPASTQKDKPPQP